MAIDKNKELEIDDAQLKAVLADVVAEVNTVLKSEVAPLENLAKAHQGEDISSEPQADTTETKTAPESSGPEAAKPEDGDANDGPSASAPTDAPETPVEAAPTEAGPEEVPGAEVGPIDVDALAATYGELDDESLNCHYIAIKTAIMQRQAAAQPAPEAAPPVQAAPAAAPALAGPPEIAQKSEKDLEIESLKKSLDEANTNAEKVFEQLNKIFNAPLRKSVTSLDQVQEIKDTTYKNMTKTEISAALDKVIRSSKPLSKSDQTLIINWELGHTKVDELAHLLTATK